MATYQRKRAERHSSSAHRAMFLAMALLAVAAQAWGQQPRHENLGVPDVIIYDNPDTAAAFPGGNKALAAYLADNVVYPQGAKVNLTVPVNVVIETNGTILSAKANDGWYHQQYPAHLAAAERVVKRMPRWTPARYDGRPVRQRLRLLVPFRDPRKDVYTDEAFLNLFPPIKPDSLHIFYNEEVFKGDTIDYALAPQIFDTFPGHLWSSSGPLALGRFALDKHHTALLIRHEGRYEGSQITLFVWDNEQHRITTSYVLADVWGDAGDVYAKESWIDKDLTIVTREVFYYINIEDIDDSTYEASGFTQGHIEGITETLTETRWCDSLFRTTLLPYKPAYSYQYGLTVEFIGLFLDWLHAQCPCTLLYPASELFTGPYADPRDKMPRYPGGDEAMKQYFAENLRWPGEGQCDIVGSVYLLVTIENDGSVGCVCTLHDLGCQAGQEAERLVRAMPRWLPAEYHGNPVRSQIVITIPFVRSER